MRHPEHGLHHFLRQAHRLQPAPGFGGRGAVQQLVAGGCHQLELALVGRLQHPGVEPALADLALDGLIGVDGVARVPGLEQGDGIRDEALRDPPVGIRPEQIAPRAEELPL